MGHTECTRTGTILSIGPVRFGAVSDHLSVDPIPGSGCSLALAVLTATGRRSAVEGLPRHRLIRLCAAVHSKNVHVLTSFQVSLHCARSSLFVNALSALPQPGDECVQTHQNDSRYCHDEALCCGHLAVRSIERFDYRRKHHIATIQTSAQPKLVSVCASCGPISIMLVRMRRPAPFSFE